jgi:hypothetical protein
MLVSAGCETCSPTVREDEGMGVFENEEIVREIIWTHKAESARTDKSSYYRFS